MVFYNLLPTELWFIIYKMEHSSFLSSVNAEIKKLYEEVKHVNARMFINMPFEEFGEVPADIAWNVNEWLAFKSTTGACIDIEGISSAWVSHTPTTHQRGARGRSTHTPF